jgi:hypothetical protein
MRNEAFLHRACLGLFATAVFFVGTSVVVVPSSAQQADHLQCYQVTDSNLGKKQAVTTFNDQFKDEVCKVVKKAKSICAPTIKNGGDDGRAGAVSAQDYVCYTAICKPKRKRTVHTVDDQFGNRLMRVGNARTICTPAVKSPPLECGQTHPQCDGECPVNTRCVPRTIEGSISCFCQ